MTKKEPNFVDNLQAGIKEIRKFAVLFKKKGINKVSIGRTGMYLLENRLYYKGIENPKVGDNFYYFKCIDKEGNGDINLAIEIEVASHNLTSIDLYGIEVVNLQRTIEEEKEVGSDRTFYIYMHAV